MDVLARYAQTGTMPARIRYVTNAGDTHHLVDHYEPFAAALEEQGHASVIARSFTDDGPGHVRIPREAFLSTIAEEAELLSPTNP